MEDYILVYEISDNSTNYLWLIPFIPVIVGLIMIINQYNNNRNSLDKPSYGIIIIGSFCCFLGLMGVFLSFQSKIPYDEILEIYRNEKYEVVEGLVHSFKKEQKSESFMVGEIKFKHYYAVIDHNNFINSNYTIYDGRAVRIGYISRENSNIILKLEIKDD